MTLVKCGFCNSDVTIDKIGRHLLKVHYNQDFDKVNSYIIEYNLPTRFSIEIWNDNKNKHNKNEKSRRNKLIKELRKAEKYENDLIYQEKKIQAQKIIDQKKRNNIKQKVSNDFNTIVNEIEKLKSKNYFEEAELDIIRIKSDLELILSKDIDSEFIKFRKNKYNNLNTEIEQIELNLPSKIEFIKDQCQTFYITWEDIKFDKNYIKINVNKGFAQPYEISGSLKVLNELKSEYFQRYFKNEIYKIITFKGIIQENISKAKGILEIKKIIQNHIDKIVKSERIDVTDLENERTNFDSENIHDYLQKISYKNEFISIPAALMTQNDSAIGMLENNNGKLEECLVYIFNRNSKKIVLWENTNPNRAGYLFEFDMISFDNNFTKLMDLISSQIEYKRESLFRGVNLKTCFKVDCNSYYLFIHETISEYKRRLRNFV